MDSLFTLLFSELASYSSTEKQSNTSVDNKLICFLKIVYGVFEKDYYDLGNYIEEVCNVILSKFLFPDKIADAKCQSQKSRSIAYDILDRLINYSPKYMIPVFKVF